MTNLEYHKDEFIKVVESKEPLECWFAKSFKVAHDCKKHGCKTCKLEFLIWCGKEYTK